jgi:hypothetical protein
VGAAVDGDGTAPRGEEQNKELGPERAPAKCQGDTPAASHTACVEHHTTTGVRVYPSTKGAGRTAHTCLMGRADAPWVTPPATGRHVEFVVQFVRPSPCKPGPTTREQRNPGQSKRPSKILRNQLPGSEFVSDDDDEDNDNDDDVLYRRTVML